MGLLLSAFSLCILLPFYGVGQQARQVVKPNVYAVVVGISAYEHKEIPALSFAHRDAEIFADYLKSPAGGSVPEEHLRTLINGEATYAAIYEGLNWLLETSKEDDLVYFYFSGHGDMENTTMYKLGFLLSYNTPKTNYINNAVRIEDLNYFANTLSVKTKAKVVLITDACHSGKLAGSEYRGNFLVGDQLRAVKNNEIRITSCSTDQLSAEDEGWGNGRGVFSYYLVNGLQGYADSQEDGIITVNEIQSYLDSMMAIDPLLSLKEHKQKPVINGNKNFGLATVNKTEMRKIMPAPIVGSQQGTNELLAPLEKQPTAYFFEPLEQVVIEEFFDFKNISSLSAAEIPFACIAWLRDSLPEIVNQEKLQELEMQLKENEDALKRFNGKLLLLLSKRGQQVINLYLDGDEAELERQRYYNSDKNNYDDYPYMFSVAKKLTASGSFLSQMLDVKYHYFSGVAARLKMPLEPDQSALLQLALQAQLKAFALDSNTAYINNELGILYHSKKQFNKAEKHFLEATRIAPQWAVAWSNLSDLYLDMNKMGPALDAAVNAQHLQPSYQGSYINKGLIYEKQGNLLLAEEFLRKSISLNTRHYLPFERLGYTYIATSQFALADSFLFEASERKKGFYIPIPGHTKRPKLDNEIREGKSICLILPGDVGTSDVMGNFSQAFFYYEAGNIAEAEKLFRKVISLDRTNPLAWHYLGKLLYEQQRWKEAEIMLLKADENFLENNEFDAYSKKLVAVVSQNSSTECITSTWTKSYYAFVNNHFLLASLYEQWGQYSLAEKHFQVIIREDPMFLGSYQALYTMLENTGRYADAEKIMYQLRQHEEDAASNALHAFHKRMIARNPEEKEWYYKAGTFLYELVKTDFLRFAADFKDEMPVEEKVFIGRQLMPPVKAKPILLPGTNIELMPPPKISTPYTHGIRYLQVADSLYADEHIVAEINQKIGDLYTWQGLPTSALPYYKKSVSLQPGNANTRMKLVQALSRVYQLSDALSQLDSLNQRGQINYEMQLLHAELSMHAKKYTDAQKMISELAAVYPYTVPGSIAMQAKLEGLKKSHKSSIDLYKKAALLETDNTDYLYSIARTYARSNNNRQAIEWLGRAIQKGFNYGFVINADESWNALKKNNNFTALVKKIIPKAY